ncbi:condensation domain-containing protein [Streptomyces physcomitrii]|uniref:condensation domain-containing protein n=1 Tax=Streptomyces physcomitrii TaxID=2724184 RepID=UPI0034323AD5
MKFIDIGDLDVRPGRLTVWRPTAGSPTPAHWTPDERPASYLQEAHLFDALLSADSGERGPSWLATAFELPGALDTAALRAALLGWVDRHESLRSRLVPSRGEGGGRMARETLRPGAVDLAADPRGEFTDGRELGRVIEELLDGATDPLAWPSFVFATVGHPGSTTVYLAFDHHHVDGYSIFLIAHEIRELYAAALDGRRAQLTDVGSFLDFAGWEREDAALVHGGHETVLRWREFLQACGGRLPEFLAPLAPEEESGRVAQRGGITWLLDREQAEGFHRACKEQGGNFASGILACLALAAREGSGLEDFRVMTPFHTRSQSQWQQSLGWYVGLAPVHFPVRPDAVFAEVMKEAYAALDRAKPLASVPFARITELLGLPLEPRFMVSYMDIRRTPGAEQWADWKAAALRSRRMNPHEVYLWIMRSPEGAYLSYRFPDTARGRAAVLPYLAGIERLAQQVAAPHTSGSRGKEPAPC